MIVATPAEVEDVPQDWDYSTRHVCYVQGFEDGKIVLGNPWGSDHEPIRASHTRGVRGGLRFGRGPHPAGGVPMRATARRALGIGVLLALAACGGGGTGSSPSDGTEEPAPPDPGPECVGETGPRVRMFCAEARPCCPWAARSRTRRRTRTAQPGKPSSRERSGRISTSDTTWTVAVGEPLTVAGEQ